MVIKMHDDKNFEKAKQKIDKLVDQLSELNNGEDIPLAWKNYFIKAIRPLAKKSGRKLDTKKHADIVNRILNDMAMISDQEFGHTATYKDKIAKEFGVSRKTIDNKINDIRKVIREKMQDPIKLNATIQGFSDHMSDSCDAEDKENEVIKKKRVELFNKKHQVSSSK